MSSCVPQTCVHGRCQLPRRTRHSGGETPTRIVPSRQGAADDADRGSKGGRRPGDKILDTLRDERGSNLQEESRVNGWMDAVEVVMSAAVR